ncbi:MAG: BtpA/SgcQ family protein [Gemmatimonadaceae bacterium]
MTRFNELFPRARPLIGMIALPPLPGYPAFRSMDALVGVALDDLAALEAGGVDGVLVENDFDQPHTLVGGAEIIAAMTRVTHEVVRRARVPVGIEVLLNDWRGSLAVASASGARFIRLDFFVDRVRSKLGVIEPEPEAILAYRSRILADSVQIFADLQVKYTTMVDGPKSISQSATEAANAGADAVIVTGTETGIGPSVADLTSAKGVLPVLIGSGLSPHNAAELVPHADGFIVGTSMRSGGGREATDRVVRSRVEALVQAIRAA